MVLITAGIKFQIDEGAALLVLVASLYFASFGASLADGDSVGARIKARVELSHTAESLEEANLRRSSDDSWRRLLRRAPKRLPHLNIASDLDDTVPTKLLVAKEQPKFKRSAVGARGEVVQLRQRQSELHHLETGYTLWQKITAMNGSLCADANGPMYVRHYEDMQASNLNRCMDACEGQPWCATMSFHGNPNALTEANYCILTAYPCAIEAGMDSALPSATDDTWLNYNYSDWVQVSNMTGKHCSDQDTFYQHQQEVNTLEDCMTTCLEWSFCNYVSYQSLEGNCDLVTTCITEADVPHTEGFKVFR